MQSQEGEKRGFIYAWTEYYLQPNTNDIVHEQLIICRQLFAGHVVSSWPTKGENNLHPMIILFIILSIVNKLPACSLFFLSFLHLLHINFVLFDFRFTGLLASALALHPRHLTGNILIRVKRTVSCQEWPHTSSTMYMLNQYTTHLTRWLQHD